MIYLDNAATTSPKPQPVIRAAGRAMAGLSANPGRSGHRLAAAAADAVYAARKTAAEFFGVTSPENVIFTPGCTYSVNQVLKGALRPGDHVIISDMEHNAVVRPLFALERDNNISVSRARVAEGDHDATAMNFARLIQDNTRMIFATHASNVFGLRLPAEKIGRICRDAGILFGIDAAQSAGLLPVDINTLNADMICVPGHKGLYGAMGAGLLLLREGAGLRPIIEGGTGSRSALRSQPDDLPDLLESGTPNLPGILAMAAGIDWLNETGTDKIAAHEYSLIRRAWRGLDSIPGVRLYTGIPELSSHVPLLSFNISNIPSERVGEELNRRGIAVRAGFHCAYDAHMKMGTSETGAVRICPSAFTTEDEIDTFLSAAENISVDIF
ncbi:MAG: aminotransferase class V-fold PLP-dependent enzyme [Oscillospiraceae bacterium]|nr:aminotransferase class V-fold PLP-dependent enzyme [Oscillospiraceae bacterium]